MDIETILRKVKSGDFPTAQAMTWIARNYSVADLIRDLEELKKDINKDKPDER